MARWHIDKNGQLCRCMAIFRACPRKMHFDSEAEGQAYISKWDSNRMKYKSLINEDILEPKNRFVLPVSEFNDQSFFDGLNADKDSFAIVLGEEDTRNGVYFMFRQKILNNEMAPEDLSRALDKIGTQQAGTDADKVLDRRDGQPNKGKTFKEIMDLRFEDGLKRVWTERRDITSIVLSFGYRASDKVLDDNTKIRIFTKEEAPKYDFDDFSKIEGTNNGEG